MPKLPSAPNLPGCNFHCKFYTQPGCGIAEVSCRVPEASAIASYNAACEALLSPWRIQNAQIQLTCKSLTVPAEAACQSLKTIINTAGGKIDLGSVRLDGTAHLRAYADINALKFANDLSTVSFSLATSAVVPIHIDFRLHSKAAGKLTCPFDMHHTVDCVGTGQANNAITTKLTIAEGHHDTLLLHFEVSPLTAQAKLAPAPLEIINGTFSSSFLSCPVLSQAIGPVGVTLNIVKGFHDIFEGTEKGDLQSLIFDGNYKVSTGTYPIDVPIVCKPIKVLHDSLNLQPLGQPTYIGFQVRS